MKIYKIEKMHSIVPVLIIAMLIGSSEEARTTPRVKSSIFDFPLIKTCKTSVQRLKKGPSDFKMIEK